MNQEDLDGLRRCVAAEKLKPGQYNLGRGEVEQLYSLGGLFASLPIWLFDSFKNSVPKTKKAP